MGVANDTGANQLSKKARLSSAVGDTECSTDAPWQAICQSPNRPYWGRLGFNSVSGSALVQLSHPRTKASKAGLGSWLVQKGKRSNPDLGTSMTGSSGGSAGGGGGACTMGAGGGSAIGSAMTTGPGASFGFAMTGSVVGV